MSHFPLQPPADLIVASGVVSKTCWDYRRFNHYPAPFSIFSVYTCIGRVVMRFANTTRMGFVAAIPTLVVFAEIGDSLQ